MLTYTVVLTPEEDGIAINVNVPAMPGVMTWGRTVEEALAAAQEAIELHLESYAERGRPFPADKRPHGEQLHKVTVRPPASAGRRTA